MSDKFTKTALLSVLLMAFAPGAVLGQAVEKKGTTPYVTHFITRGATGMVTIIDLDTEAVSGTVELAEDPGPDTTSEGWR